MTALTASQSGGSVTTITVRGLDDSTVRALKLRAAREGRSMEAEVRSILTTTVAKADDESGFGTLLAGIFAGVSAPEMPARTDFPEDVDLP
jgi:plasmid stability protein